MNVSANKPKYHSHDKTMEIQWKEGVLKKLLKEKLSMYNFNQWETSYGTSDISCTETFHSPSSLSCVVFNYNWPNNYLIEVFYENNIDNVCNSFSFQLCTKF